MSPMIWGPEAVYFSDKKTPNTMMEFKNVLLTIVFLWTLLYGGTSRLRRSKVLMSNRKVVAKKGRDSKIESNDRQLRSMSDNTPEFCPEDLTFVSKEIVEDLKRIQWRPSTSAAMTCCWHSPCVLSLWSQIKMI